MTDSLRSHLRANILSTASRSMKTNTLYYVHTHSCASNTLFQKIAQTPNDTQNNKHQKYKNKTKITIKGCWHEELFNRLWLQSDETMPQAIQFKIVPERNSAKTKRATTQTTSATQPIAPNTKRLAKEHWKLLCCQKSEKKWQK